MSGIHQALIGSAGITSLTLSQYQTEVNSYPGAVNNTASGTPPPDVVARVTNFSGANLGTMWGSSYMQYTTTDSTFLNVLMHAFPSRAVFDAFLANSGTLLIQIASAGTQNYFALDRNGYLSSNYGAYPGFNYPFMIYWDYIANKAMKIYPFLGTGPEEYYGE
jgi:hypothetical protein